MSRGQQIVQEIHQIRVAFATWSFHPADRDASRPIAIIDRTLNSRATGRNGREA